MSDDAISPSAEAKLVLVAFTHLLEGRSSRFRPFQLRTDAAELLFDLDRNAQLPIFEMRRRLNDWAGRSDLDVRERELVSLRHGLALTVLPLTSHDGSALDGLFPRRPHARGRRPLSNSPYDDGRSLRYQLKAIYAKLGSVLTDRPTHPMTVRLKPEADFLTDGLQPPAATKSIKGDELRQLVVSAVHRARRYGQAYPDIQQANWLNLDWWVWRNAHRFNPPLGSRRPVQRINQERLAAGHALVADTVYWIVMTAAHREDSRPTSPRPAEVTIATVDPGTSGLLAYLAKIDTARSRIEELVASMEASMRSGVLTDDLAALLNDDYERLTKLGDPTLLARAATVMTRASADSPGSRGLGYRWYAVGQHAALPEDHAEMALNVSVSLSGEGRYAEAEHVLTRATVRLRQHPEAALLLAIGESAWRRRILTDRLGNGKVVLEGPNVLVGRCVEYARVALLLSADRQSPHYARSLIRLVEATSIVGAMELNGVKRLAFHVDVPEVRRAIDVGIRGLERLNGDGALTTFDQARLVVMTTAREAMDRAAPLIEFGVKRTASGPAKPGGRVRDG